MLLISKFNKHSRDISQMSQKYRQPTVDEAVNIIKKTILDKTKKDQFASWEREIGKPFVAKVKGIIGGNK